MNLRKYAKGKPCMIRLPGCHYNDETTVLCHHRGPSTGMGAKEPDVIGAWGCCNCHSLVDGRSVLPEGWTRENVKNAFADGILRTIKMLVNDGVLKW